MELLINRNEKWSDTEDKKLLDEYNNGKNVVHLGLIHGRTPGACAARLQQLNIIKHREDAVGYDEYINSDLYKKICEEVKNKKKGKK